MGTTTGPFDPARLIDSIAVLPDIISSLSDPIAELTDVIGPTHKVSSRKYLDSKTWIKYTL